MCEDGRAVLSEMFVEQDASVGLAQQPRQRGLAVEERPITQILAITPDQIKRVEDRGSRSLPAAQLFEA